MTEDSVRQVQLDVPLSQYTDKRLRIALRTHPRAGERVEIREWVQMVDDAGETFWRAGHGINIPPALLEQTIQALQEIRDTFELTTPDVTDGQ
ncbi:MULTISPECIES: hypothetical protein [Nonomuraea]|uniref:hypothetical protein n=1 Tax=Nonomuraea TaxID=83681 RepID=UPI0012F7B56B|nr:hypothetical protein [Nonomuraea typhae]